MLRIKESALQKIIAQAEKDYPYETCGLLLGKAEGEIRNVFGAFKTPNANAERKNDRYEIYPKDYLKAAEKAKNFGVEIIGVYTPAKIIQADHHSLMKKELLKFGLTSYFP